MSITHITDYKFSHSRGLSYTNNDLYYYYYAIESTALLVE